MKQPLWIAFAILAVCAGFAAGWLAEQQQAKNKRNGSSANSSRSGSERFDCDHAADNQWHTLRSLSYQPTKKAYTAIWEDCPAVIQGYRVRVMDANFQKTFFQYEDDEIVRIEELDLLDNHMTQLLVVTGSSGTDDRKSWHIIGEIDGQLREWKWPDYDTVAEKFLRADESFSKAWNLHLQHRNIFLAEGIYAENDGNCCPTRGGVLVQLIPVIDGLKFGNVQRISASEYDRWSNKPFCSQCTLE